MCSTQHAVPAASKHKHSKATHQTHTQPDPPTHSPSCAPPSSFSHQHGPEAPAGVFGQSQPHQCAGGCSPDEMPVHCEQFPLGGVVICTHGMPASTVPNHYNSKRPMQVTHLYWSLPSSSDACQHSGSSGRHPWQQGPHHHHLQLLHQPSSPALASLLQHGTQQHIMRS